MSLLLAAALLVSCKNKDETDTGETGGPDTDTDCQATDWFTDADADGFGDDLTLVSACEKPNGTVDQGGDCDDVDADVHPGATEACNLVDDDCDGTVDDEADLQTFYADADDDGYGDVNVSLQACEAPAGYVADGTDCDDTNVAFNPGALEEDCEDPADYNCDGSVGFADADSDGSAACKDCDDADPLRSPDLIESCNDIDDDCDGLVDDEAVDVVTWYADADGDEYGVDTDTLIQCDEPVGYVSASGDCDDTDIAWNPGATEACDDVNDYNCDGSVEYADADSDGFAACDDCDDADADVNPDADEVCNGVDDDCTGSVDDGASDAPTWYYDSDADGYGDSLVTVDACDAPSNHVSTSADCDDDDAAYHPGAAETCDDPTDYNCDGSVAYADVDADGFAACDDCDDAVATINPDGVESCNGADDDCDDLTDEPDAIDASTWYADTDGDGFGDAASSVVACSAPTGFVADDTDCDDTNEALNPDTVWYADVDLDAFGDADDTTTACEQPTGYIAASGDCDDAVGAVNPDADEVCNDVDDDCDGSVDTDASDALTWYADGDTDGYGDATETLLACDAPSGFVSGSTDCDDAAATTFPGADETCNAEDDDCDGTVDNDYATDAGTWWYDGDGDGYGGSTVSEKACEAPADHFATSADCDDVAAAVHPGATEVCDALDVDEDCDGASDDDDTGVTGQGTYYTDGDLDGYGGASYASCDAGLTASGDCDDAVKAINPAATEVCDSLNVDEDCDGTSDDADASATGKTTYYTDGDVDTYGTGSGTSLCDATGTTTATVTGDCNDAATAVNPSATEVCDAADVDEDCDGTSDDEDASVTGKDTYYTDADTDGFGGSTSYLSCEAGLTASTDCNDAVKAINPAATEVCDETNVDEDCDGASDDADTSVTGQTTYYNDLDGDLYAGSTSYASCEPGGYSSSSDCLDTDKGVYPGAPETAGDTIDQDCDGSDLDQIDYAHHQFACSYGIAYGKSVTGYGWVYQAGVTDSVGMGAGIAGEMGYGPDGDAPTEATWKWTAGSYLGDKDGLSPNANDEYQASFTPTSSGVFDVAWRFTADGGRSYVYGDLGSDCGGSGSTDGFNSPAALTVLGTDADLDGHDSVATGGDDCDDAVKEVNPGAVETKDDGIDNDCANGDDVSVANVAVGDLVISEIMYNPTVINDEFGEYFEIYNPSANTILLEGLYVTDTAGSSTSFALVGSTLEVLPGDWFVLGRTTDTGVNDGATVDYAWGTATSSIYQLANGSTGDSILLKTSPTGTIIDQVIYGTTFSSGWPSSVNGTSIELGSSTYTAVGNDTGPSWCKGVDLYGASNKGTPGAANTGC